MFFMLCINTQKTFGKKKYLVTYFLEKKTRILKKSNFLTKKNFSRIYALLLSRFCTFFDYLSDFRFSFD